MSSRRPFALATLAIDGAAVPALVLADVAHDLRPALGAGATLTGLVHDWDGAFERLQALADDPSALTELGPVGDLRPLPPLAPFGQVFQAAANYRRHVLDLMLAAEQRSDGSDGLTDEQRRTFADEHDAMIRSGRPFVFMGSANAIVGAHDDVLLPPESTQPDWELELAAVIGRPGHRVPRERALELVAGYTICNDLTCRDLLVRTEARTLPLDWLAAKNSPTFLPTGPLLVPAVHAGDPMDLQIELRLNGDTMQDERTADMIFDVATIIEHVSHVAELRPGDLVLTGSPAGNGASHGVFLKPGDELVGEITGLGRQRNRCVAAPA